jgi:cell division protein FtsN
MTLTPPDAARTVRRRQFGGAASVFLTFSLLLFVMVLGFIFGRVVIARAYIKGMGTLVKPAEPPVTRDQARGPVGTVFAPPVEGTAPAGQESVLTPDAAPGSPEQAPEEGAPAPEPPQPEEALSPAPGAAEPETPEPVVRDVRYAVQVGLFGSEDGARDTLRQLTQSGHPSRIEVDRQATRTMYRVLSGSYRNEANARKALDEIRGEGFAEAFVVAR